MDENFCFVFGRQQLSQRLATIITILLFIKYSNQYASLLYPIDSAVYSASFISASDATLDAGPMPSDAAAKRQRTGY